MVNLRWIPAATLLLLQAGHADVRSCVCDLDRPETLAARECSLCKAAEAQPATPEFFALKDANPNKPHRLLVLPRFHGRNPQDLADFTPEKRAAYWTFAIDKAHELWGDSWGLAINSLERRTQCHAHIHIGKLRDGYENDRFVVVDGPASIPLPKDGDGLLIHPIPGGKFHAHHGDDSPELSLDK
jgi:diadenosine tetraphosphate (Ap4A) HIT family hydrolase